MKRNYFVPFLLCLVMISCHSSPTGEATNTTDESLYSVSEKKEERLATIKEIADTDKETRNHLTASDTASELVVQQAAPIIDFDKQIIKTAGIELECKVYDLFNGKLHALVKQHGGWIAAENETRQNNRINNSMSVKVPVAQFEALVYGLGNIDGKIISKSITTHDVTGEVVDAEGRVKVKKVMRDKYVAMLEAAKKMQDVLAVQEKIDDMHEEIEMNAIRALSLKQQAAYSTINIHYYQPIEGAVGEDETPGIGNRILTAATNGSVWLGNLLVGIIGAWPLVLAAIMLFYFVRKKMAQPVPIKTKEEQS
ncbi:MAG: DUF4349 domain-containing protein [Bacteroidota bacterium]